MKKVVLFSILFGVFLFGGGTNISHAIKDGGANLLPWLAWESNMETNGYSCIYCNPEGTVCEGDANYGGISAGRLYCTKTTGYNYSATVDGTYTLTGVKTAIVDTRSTSWQNSPFIYFSNPPQGNIAVTLNSKLNSYLPLQPFNRTNGWTVIGDKQKGTISIDGIEQKNLFYELAMNSVTLNRHGQNFSSKEEIISYLQNSDFFDKLDFSTEQKENSFKYVLQKLSDSKVNTRYYYLTILTDESVADISTLTIQPKPKKLIRSYFAVYPTNVPVKTEGNFVFPETKENKSNDFIVKETGEFLIPSGMTIFFK